MLSCSNILSSIVYWKRVLWFGHLHNTTPSSFSPSYTSYYQSTKSTPRFWCLFIFTSTITHLSTPPISIFISSKLCTNITLHSFLFPKETFQVASHQVLLSKIELVVDNTFNIVLKLLHFLFILISLIINRRSYKL